MNISRKPFGTLPDGRDVELFTLSDDGIEIRITPYGGIVTGIAVPGGDGAPVEIVLGHDTLDPYVRDNSPYLGVIAGRFANRIAGGRFTLDGNEYQLTVNNGPNHLHGGNRGFDKHLWDAEPFTDPSGAGVRLTLVSPDGDEGYPGAVCVTAIYTLTAGGALRLEFRAVTDAPTIINLTNHTYFNLAGGGDILGHEVFIDAGRYTPIDPTSIPLGELAPVAGTPFDFTTPARIGDRIDADHPQTANGRGIDHNFVLNTPGDLSKPAAHAVDPASGRTLEIRTTQPGIQFYTGNFLTGAVTGRGGVAYDYRTGFCLETQHFPDSPNHPEYPPVVLRPGEELVEATEWRFGNTD